MCRLQSLEADVLAKEFFCLCFDFGDEILEHFGPFFFLQNRTEKTPVILSVQEALTRHIGIPGGCFS